MATRLMGKVRLTSVFYGDPAVGSWSPSNGMGRLTWLMAALRP